MLCLGGFSKCRRSFVLYLSIVERFKNTLSQYISISYNTERTLTLMNINTTILLYSDTKNKQDFTETKTVHK